MGTESEVVDQPELLNAKYPELNDIKIRMISAGFDHTLIVSEDNKVYALGRGNAGQLGMGKKVTHVTKPTLIASLVNHHIEIKEGCCGGHHSLLLSHDGNVYSFGWNEYGELGLGIQKKNKFTPTLISYFRDNKIEIKQISCGGDHSLVLSKNGEVYSFGWGEYGQLGHNNTVSLNVPRKIALNDVIVQVAAGGYAHSLLLNDKGEVYAFGWNSDGQLGLEGRSNELLPRKIPGVSRIKLISAGYVNSALVNEKGEVFIFGSNVYGQLGIISDDDDESGVDNVDDGDDGANSLRSVLNKLDWNLLFEDETEGNDTSFIVIEGTFDPSVVGISQRVNQRPTQEDVALYVENVVPNDLINERKVSLFGVFDGHGGSTVSKYLGNHFGEVLRSLLRNESNTHNNFTHIMEQAYAKLDTQLRREVRDARFVGSTALVCLFVRVNYTVNDLDTEVSERNSGLSFSSTKFLTTNNTHFLDGSLYCANAGDSEAILMYK
jgi:hypothetical protein